MNTLHNLPIILCYEEDGSVVATCPLMPKCHCKCPTRALALQMMQRLIKDALLTTPLPSAPNGTNYEVIHLAISPTKDAVNRLHAKTSRQPKPESSRLEVP